MAEHTHDSMGRDEPDVPEAPEPRFHDPAAESLADALRVSFSLLRLIMIAVVVLFLATGIRSIEEQEMGILKVFGREVGTAGAGLVYNWPFPVGQIEIVDVREQSLEIDDFWMHVDPEDKYKDISELRIPREGLEPGLDGALLTGDRNLLHVKFNCTYAVRDPVAYAGSITDLGQTIRSVVCAEAIRQAGLRTAKSILRTDPVRFAQDVRAGAQKRLDTIVGKELAVQLNAIMISGRTWPLRALPAYQSAQRASQDSERIINDAIGSAKQELNEAAGGSYAKLVGEPWKLQQPEPAAQAAQVDSAVKTDPNEYDLIGQYERVRRRGDSEAAARLSALIDETLTSSLTGGQASEIIAEATAYRTAIKQRVKARAERFSQLLPEFERDPQFMIDRLWAATRDEILGSPTNEKFYVTLGNTKFVWRITRDPNVARQIREAMLKAEQEALRP